MKIFTYVKKKVAQQRYFYKAMATQGQSIYNKVSTDKIVFLKTRQDTKGALLQFENYHQPNGIGPVAHCHPLQEEKFIVLNGAFTININGHAQTVKAGEEVTVPAGAMHHWQITGTEELHMITEFRPALHFEEIIETIASLAQKGKMDKAGKPDPMQMSATLNKYYGEFFLGTMPMWLQRFLFGAFGRVLRIFGYKAVLQYRQE